MSTVVTQEMTKAMNRAKVNIMASPDSVFISRVMLSVRHIWDDSIPTACTNGRVIKYNPDFFMDQTLTSQSGLISHETWHIILMHVVRRMHRHHGRYNAAGDYVINLLVEKMNLTLPAGALINYQYEGMSTEQVYDLLEDDCSQGSMSDDIMDCDPTDTGLQADLEDIIVQAAMASKGRDKPGSIPGEVEVFIDRLLNPIVPWYKHLSPYMTSLVKTGANYTRPNRRYWPKVFVPTQLSNCLPSIAAAADISGSVSDEGFHHYCSEGGSVVNSFKPETLTFITFDTKIRTINTIKHMNEMTTIQFTGRGGTNIDPVMQWAVDNNPNLLLVFTDGYYTEPTIRPACPIIWIVSDNPGFKAPFGKHIEYNYGDY